MHETGDRPASLLRYNTREQALKLPFYDLVTLANPRLEAESIQHDNTAPAAADQPGTLELMVEENGFTKSLATFDLKNEIIGNNSLILRLVKKGSLYTAFYSLDGNKFETLGKADVLLKDVRAGLISCDGVITTSQRNSFWFNPDTTKPGTPFDVSFDYFHITNSGLK